MTVEELINKIFYFEINVPDDLKVEDQYLDMLRAKVHEPAVIEKIEILRQEFHRLVRSAVKYNSEEIPDSLEELRYYFDLEDVLVKFGYLEKNIQVENRTNFEASWVGYQKLMERKHGKKRDIEN